jgi:hypothetical protein
MTAAAGVLTGIRSPSRAKKRVSYGNGKRVAKQLLMFNHGLGAKLASGCFFLQILRKIACGSVNYSFGLRDGSL